MSPNNHGTWTAPDLATAQRLIREAHVAGTHVTVWTTSDPGLRSFLRVGRATVRLLDRLGFRADIKLVPGVGPYFGAIFDSRNRAQTGPFGWFQDYPGASDFLQLLLGCSSYVPADPRSNSNAAEFCNAAIDRMSRRALRLQTTDPPAANEEWARVDRAVVEAAPWAPLYNPTGVDFVSQRVGNYQNSPQWFLLTDQVWLK